MTWIVQNLWLIPSLPLLAAAVTALAKRPQRTLAATLATGSMGASFLLSCWALVETLGEQAAPGVARQVYNFDWLQFGDAWLQLGWVLDPLTAVMLVMVTFVGLLIFIYSVGYLAHDDNFTRFFCFMSLFAAAMLGVVIANSLLFLFVSWELVGFSSYLLIGFWYHKPSAAAAAKKAFIVTRIGDIGFFLGLLWLYAKTGTLLFYDGGKGCLEESSLTHLVTQTTRAGMAISTGISLLIFCGAIGKSGQVPLHVWLPDAMEGPTPVSALIHAATMVAAGVFLVARVYPLMEATKPISAVAEAAHEPTHSLPLPRAEQASVRAVSVPLLGGVRGGFMVPMLVQILEVGPTREPERRTRVRYGFNARSAAVLGSSNVSTPNTPELYQISAALEPAAPEDGRTPIFTYPVHHGVLCPASGHRAEQEFGAPALLFACRDWVGREQVGLPGGVARSVFQH